MNGDELIAIGKFGRTRGLRGFIFVVPYGDDPSRFMRLEKALLMVDGEPQELIVESAKMQGERPTIKVAGYNTLELARTLTNRDLFIRAAELEELPEGQHYAFEVEGCSVVTVDGEKVGTVVEIEAFPASDMYVIEDEAGKRYLLPALARFVKEVDVKARKIEIDPPEGWMQAQ
jgi:16S rRNA processing protein RimM